MNDVLTPDAEKSWISRRKEGIKHIGCWLIGHVEDPTEADPVPPADLIRPDGIVLRSSSSADLGPPTVTTSGLTKVYPGNVVGARDISIQAHGGEIVAVVGPNGAGKSTTLNMLAGLLAPTGGSATILDVPVTDIKRLARVVGVALQTSGLDPAMTGREHFHTQAALYGLPRARAAESTANLLELFGLQPYADRQVANYSGGLQRRLVLALALVHDPSVIIMDEPTAGLDPQTRRMVWDLLARLRQGGRTILFSTQLLEEADILAQRLYVINDGGVVAEGTPAQLREAYGELSVKVRLPGGLDSTAEMLAGKLPRLAPPRRESDCLVFTTTHGSRDAERILALLEDTATEYLELTVGRPSLEDAFVRLTGATVRPEPLLTAAASSHACQL
jgi:ABC-2 type transport system ATP-binding protein